jgi:hypothetical protein
VVVGAAHGGQAENPDLPNGGIALDLGLDVEPSREPSDDGGVMGLRVGLLMRLAPRATGEVFFRGVRDEFTVEEEIRREKVNWATSFGFRVRLYLFGRGDGGEAGTPAPSQERQPEAR